VLGTTVFHSIQEDDLLDVCPYCKRDINPGDFRSEHHVFIHYKMLECDCGKRLSVKVDFESDGNDKWACEKTIEAKIRAAEVKNKVEKNE
jgi:hypothetical protein